MRCFLCGRIHWIFLVSWIQAAAMDDPVRTRLPWPSKPALDKNYKDLFRTPKQREQYAAGALPHGYLPVFDRNIARNVTTQRGQSGYLHCVVNNIEDKTVSWIRRRDFHVLTVGLDTYTSENRFEISHVASTNDWVLKINYAQVHDSGVYECQVSSDPKISFFVHLNVVVAVANILSAPDLFVRRGSSINLTCIISQCPEPPLFVFWYHNRRMINYDVTKAEISVHKAGEDTAVSRLFIRAADVEDSGNFTCCPSNAAATSIQVHVVLDEKQEAIQHDSSHSSSRAPTSDCGMLYLVLTLLSLSSKRHQW